MVNGEVTGWKRTLFRYVPALETASTYSASDFRRDLFAGLTVTAVAVPQAMAYASIFGAPVEYGLYTAIVMTAVGAVFDSSRQLINGPTNAISIALLSALAGVDGDEMRLTAAVMMATMIGLIQIGITLFRLGDLSRYISHSVIVGFTLGASVLLMLDQLKNVLGLKAQGDPHSPFLSRFWQTMVGGGEVQLPTLAVSLGTIGLVIVLRRFNRRFRLGIPELLVALAIVSAVVAVLGAGGKGPGKVELIHQIPRQLPSFHPPKIDWTLARELSSSALAIGLLGLLEAIAMAKSIASHTGQKLDINQQCLSEGLANLAGSFFQCFPGSGSLTRTYINHQSGAATQWSGVISAIGVAMTILVMAPYAQYIPKAALAGILIMTALRMTNPAELKYHFKATRFDALIMLATAISAVVVSVEFCVLIGVLLSFLFFVPRVSQVNYTELTLTPQNFVRHRVPADEQCGLIRIYALEGQWFFGAASDAESLLETIEEQLSAEVRVVLLRVRHLGTPDAVSMHLLEKFVHRLRRRGIRVGLCGVKKDFLQVLENVNLLEDLGRDAVYPEHAELWTSTMEAVQWAYELVGSDRCAGCPRKQSGLSMDGPGYYTI